jgi:hypothetical protein
MLYNIGVLICLIVVAVQLCRISSVLSDMNKDNKRNLHN